MLDNNGSNEFAKAFGDMFGKNGFGGLGGNSTTQKLNEARNNKQKKEAQNKREIAKGTIKFFTTEALEDKDKLQETYTKNKNNAAYTHKLQKLSSGKFQIVWSKEPGSHQYTLYLGKATEDIWYAKAYYNFICGIGIDKAKEIFQAIN